MADIGESLVGSYLRYVVGCEVVVYNTHISTVQGELDVIGLKQGEPRTVWMCEVITHILGTLYGRGYDETVKKIREKIHRCRDFATATFPADQHVYEIWSPVVPSGLVSRFADLTAEMSDASLEVAFVTNEEYTERIQRLTGHARGSTKATSEPAYRLLQILTHLRGGIDLRSTANP